MQKRILQIIYGKIVGTDMSIEHATLLLENDGETIVPTSYIYIQPTEGGFELKMKAGIGDMLNGTLILWEAIKDEAQHFSEQDLYDLCQDFDLDYEIFRAQVRGAIDE